jgi:hypothetical protein
LFMFPFFVSFFFLSFFLSSIILPLCLSSTYSVFTVFPRRRFWKLSICRRCPTNKIYGKLVSCVDLGLKLQYRFNYGRANDCSDSLLYSASLGKFRNSPLN